MADHHQRNVQSVVKANAFAGGVQMPQTPPFDASQLLHQIPGALQLHRRLAGYEQEQLQIARVQTWSEADVSATLAGAPDFVKFLI